MLTLTFIYDFRFSILRIKIFLFKVNNIFSFLICGVFALSIQYLTVFLGILYFFAKIIFPPLIIKSFNSEG